jgi:hypothetical protein
MDFLKKKMGEKRKFLIFAILFTFFWRFLPKIFHFYNLNYNDYALCLGYIILPISFSIFLGLMNFSNKGRFTPEDFYSNYKIIFWNIYLKGIFILLFLIFFSHIVFLPYKVKFFKGNPKSIFYSFYLFSLISLYTISSFASLLTGKFIINLFSFPFVFIFYIFIFLPFIVVFILISSSYILFFILVFGFFNWFLIYPSLILWDGCIKNISVKKKVIKSILLFFIFSFALNGLSNLGVNIRLKNTFEKLKKKGIKTELKEVIPQLIPYEKNGAIIYEEIFKIIEEVEKKNKKEIEFIPYQSCKKIEELKEEELKKGKKIIESDEFNKVFNLVEKAVNMPCRFNIEYGKGPEVLLPHLSRLRNLSRYIRAKIYFCLKDKKYDEAIKFAKIGLKIGDSLKDELLLISQLTRFAIDETVMMSINSIFNVKGIKISENDYIEILSILNGKQTDISKALNGDMVIFGKPVFLENRRELYEWKEKLYGWKEMEYGKFNRIIWLMSLPVIKNDYIFYLSYFSNLIEVSQKPYYSVKRDIENLKDSNLKIYNNCLVSIKHIYSAILTPVLVGSIVQKTLYSAYLDSFKIVVGLKTYKQKYGKYPERLDKLVPEILPSLPYDPFTGKEFIYHIEKDYFLIYSLGENEKDDNGIFDRKTNKDDIGWKLEI